MRRSRRCLSSTSFQQKPFLGSLSSFGGETYAQIKTTLNSSAGGTWIDTAGAGLPAGDRVHCRSNLIRACWYSVMRLNRKKIARLVAFSGLAVAGIAAVYLGLIRHPGLFFPYEFSRDGITLYSDEPIPPEPAGFILETVERRLARSPLGARPRRNNLRIYICNRRWRFARIAVLLRRPLISRPISLCQNPFLSSRIVHTPSRTRESAAQLPPSSA